MHINHNTPPHGAPSSPLHLSRTPATPSKTPTTPSGANATPTGIYQHPGSSVPGSVSMTTNPDPLLALYPAWSKASSSDSEYSDTEGVVGSTKVKTLHIKVRQGALACFHALVRVSVGLHVIVFICLEVWIFA